MAKARWIRGKAKYVKLSSDTVEELKKLKYAPYENYDTVVRRIILFYKSGKITTF